MPSPFGPWDKSNIDLGLQLTLVSLLGPHNSDKVILVEEEEALVEQWRRKKWQLTQLCVMR